MFRIGVLMVAFIFGVSAYLSGQADDFKKGLALFENKNYEASAEKFESILQTGQSSSELYYNLGNAYFQNKEAVKAILNYEKALKLNPRFVEAKFNLKIALEENNNEMIEVPDFFLTKIWRNIHTIASSNVWSILFLISFWTTVACFIFWLLGKVRKQKKQAFLFGLLLLVIAIFSFFLSSSQYEWETSDDSALVMVENLKLKSAPEAENKPILDLQPGTKLYFIDKIGEWYKVKLKNGQIGWLKGEHGLERI